MKPIILIKQIGNKIKQIGNKWMLRKLKYGYLCHAYRPESSWVHQHALSINGKRNDISKADLMTIGESIKSKKASEIIDEINDVVNQWNVFAKDVDVQPSLRKEIAKSLLNLK